MSAEISSTLDRMNARVRTLPLRSSYLPIVWRERGVPVEGQAVSMQLSLNPAPTHLVQRVHGRCMADEDLQERQRVSESKRLGTFTLTDLRSNSGSLEMIVGHLSTPSACPFAPFFFHAGTFLTSTFS